MHTFRPRSFRPMAIVRYRVCFLSRLLTLFSVPQDPLHPRLHHPSTRCGAIAAMLSNVYLSPSPLRIRPLITLISLSNSTAPLRPTMGSSLGIRNASRRLLRPPPSPYGLHSFRYPHCYLRPWRAVDCSKQYEGAIRGLVLGRDGYLQRNVRLRSFLPRPLAHRRLMHASNLSVACHRKPNLLATPKQQRFPQLLKITLSNEYTDRI